MHSMYPSQMEAHTSRGAGPLQGRRMWCSVQCALCTAQVHSALHNVQQAAFSYLILFSLVTVFHPSLWKLNSRIFVFTVHIEPLDLLPQKNSCHVTALRPRALLPRDFWSLRNKVTRPLLYSATFLVGWSADFAKFREDLRRISYRGCYGGLDTLEYRGHSWAHECPLCVLQKCPFYLFIEIFIHSGTALISIANFVV
jgi:hypothetical protein